MKDSVSNHGFRIKNINVKKNDSFCELEILVKNVEVTYKNNNTALDEG